MAVGCAQMVTGQKSNPSFKSVEALLVVFERQEFSIANRPEGGFYENGVIANQLKLEAELRKFAEDLQERGIVSEFVGIPASFGGVKESSLAWNSAIGQDRFPTMLVVRPRDGKLVCQNGGFNCAAYVRLSLRVIRRADGAVVWSGEANDVGPANLDVAERKTSSLIERMTEKLVDDGILDRRARTF